MASGVNEIFGSVSIRYGDNANITEASVDKFFNYEFLVGFSSKQDNPNEYDPNGWRLKLVVPNSNEANAEKRYLNVLTDINLLDILKSKLQETNVSATDTEITLPSYLYSANTDNTVCIKTYLPYDNNSFVFLGEGKLALKSFDDANINNGSRTFYAYNSSEGNCRVSYDKHGRITSIAQDFASGGRGNANQLNGREADYYLNGSNVKRNISNTSSISRNLTVDNVPNVIILDANSNSYVDFTILKNKGADTTDDFYIINNSGKNIKISKTVTIMYQNYIMPTDVPPMDAVISGQNEYYILLDNSVYHMHVDENNRVYILGEYVQNKNYNNPNFLTSDASEISLRPYGIFNASSNKVFDEQIMTEDGNYSFSFSIAEDCIANGEATINYIVNDNTYSANICFVLKRVNETLSLVDYQLKTIFSDSDIILNPDLKIDENNINVFIGDLSSGSKISTVIDFKNITYI